MTHHETTPEGDAALPNAYYECAECTQQGRDSNCRPADDIRLAPDETWLCEYCYDDVAYECGKFASWPVWSDLPRLSAALTAQPVALPTCIHLTADMADRCQTCNPGAIQDYADPVSSAAQPVAQEPVAGAIRDGFGRTMVQFVTTPAPVEAGLRELLDQVWNEAVEQAAVVARNCVHMTPDPDNAIRIMLNGREKLFPASASALRAQSAPVGGEVKG